MFYSVGRYICLVVSFVRGYVSSQGRVVMRNFVVGRFVLGRIVSRTFLFVELLCLYHPVWCMDSTSLFDPNVKMTLHQAVVQCVGRVECGHFFLIGQNRSSNPRSGMILKVPIPKFWRASKFSFSKSSRGNNY